MAKIFIHDEFEPQDTAMLQALYSRSPESVEKHVEKVKATGSGKFMERFYVGYGHASIADCGSTTVFIEQLSILADKAIQDWPLYSGQETSTRYVDMAKQPIIDPLDTEESQDILSDWMNFYITQQDRLKVHLRKKYPRKSDEAEEMYEKAIQARTFDIMRGFLPAGITTQLSWHTNLRQAADKLAVLHHNPLPEVRDIAEQIHKELRGKYPQSFSHPTVPEQEKYRQDWNAKYNFFDPESAPEFAFKTEIKAEELERYRDVLDSRPAKTGLPHFLTELGLLTFDFHLDYGSFRDIQRHRHGVCRMPLLRTKWGFNQWYIDQMPQDLRLKAIALIEDQKKKIAALPTDDLTRQYYVSLGFNVPCRVSYGLPAASYVVELRSGKPVHPTLRKIALQMREAVIEKFPTLRLNCDLDPDDWDARRGLQTITERK